MRKTYLYLLIAGVITLFGLTSLFFWNRYSFKGEETTSEEIQVQEEKEETKKETPKPAPLPAKYALSVPYTVQAPYANWKVHEESCEEAAVLMYHYYLTGEKFGKKNVIPEKTADKAFRDMRSWQIARYGKESDLSIKALGQFAKDYYGYTPARKTNITAEDIKRAIFEKKPVLVPVMTHSLKNPHYGPNDTYHILVITGYDKSGVTTNDAGVKEGQNYRYTWKVLFGAIDAQKVAPGREMLTLGNK